MFNVGGGEIVVILLLALLVLGPDKLPATAKKVGKFMHEMRRMTSGFEQEIRSAMDFEKPTSPFDAAPASRSDAVHRAEDGPRLEAVEPSEPSNSGVTPRPTTPDAGSFVADLSAADPDDRPQP